MFNVKYTHTHIYFGIFTYSKIYIVNHRKATIIIDIFLIVLLEAIFFLQSIYHHMAAIGHIYTYINVL